MPGWNIEVSTSLRCKPEEAHKLVTDFRNAPMIPGADSGHLISGVDGQPGSTYECRGSLLGVGRGSIEFEVAKNDPPHSVEITLLGVNVPLTGMRLTHGTARWIFSETEDGCQVTLETEGEVRGGVSYLPGAERIIEETMNGQTVGIVKNLKKQVEEAA